MVPPIGVLLANLGQPCARQPVGQPHEGRPQPAVHERQLAVDEAADEEFARLGEPRQLAEDLLALRVTPPAAADWPAGNELSDVRGDALGGDQDDAVAASEAENAVGAHARGGRKVSGKSRFRTWMPVCRPTATRKVIGFIASLASGRS